MASDRTSDSAEEMAAEVAAFLADRYGATELVGHRASDSARRCWPRGSGPTRCCSPRRRPSSWPWSRSSPPLVEAQAVAELASRPRGSGGAPDEELIASAMVGELQVVLGVGARPAGRLLDLAHRLTTVLPGHIDRAGGGPVGPGAGPAPSPRPPRCSRTGTRGWCRTGCSRWPGRARGTGSRRGPGGTGPRAP